MKKLSNESFSILKDRGHAVPRNKGNYIIPFRVGGEYTVTNEDETEALKVVCTQNCPHHLKVL